MRRMIYALPYCCLKGEALGKGMEKDMHMYQLRMHIHIMRLTAADFFMFHVLLSSQNHIPTEQIGFNLLVLYIY